MKRNSLILLLSTLAISAGVTGLTACGNNSPETVSLQTAYSAAYEYGYNGSFESFIAEIYADTGNLASQITKVELNDRNEIIITFSDDSKANLGEISCRHDYKEWSEGSAPTCTSIGYNERTCKICGDKDYEFLPATGHSAENYTVNQSSHCFVCNDCGYYVQELHHFNGTVCDKCNYEADYTVGLNYTYMKDTDSYSVSIGETNYYDTEIIIPAIYNNLPVTRIDAFYSKYLEKLIMPDSITQIANGAFSNAVKLNTVKLSANLKTIGRMAFNNCSSLTELEFPESLEIIDETAFVSSGLVSVKLPKNLTRLGQLAFTRCESLTSVNIPSDIQILEPRIFEGCTALQTVELEYGLQFISDSMFLRCSALREISIPSTVTTIGSAFANSGLTSIIIPDGVTVIDHTTFYGCKNLLSVTLPEGLKIIDSRAFENCEKLKAISIPSTVTAIGASAFANSGLTKITFVEGLTKLTANILFGCTNLAEIIIPESVTAISAGALLNCTSLTNITYNGTADGWKAINKESGWRTEDNIITNLTVTCTDGILEYIW